MTRLISNLAAATAIAVAAVLPTSLMAATLTTAYLNEPVLALTAITLNAEEFPNSIFIPGLPLTYANDIKLACRSVITGTDGLLVYSPRTKACKSINTVFDQAQNTHPQQAYFATLLRDRASVTGKLENQSYVVLKPASGLVKPNIILAGIAAEMCICPTDPPSTEQIFFDGFETTL